MLTHKKNVIKSKTNFPEGFSTRASLFKLLCNVFHEEHDENH